MKVKSVELKDFKRFTNLTIQELPEMARLIVLVGPNGSGKSSLFEAFNVYSHTSKGEGGSLDDKDYFRKVSSIDPATSWSPFYMIHRRNIVVEFYDYPGIKSESMTTSEEDKKIFYIRSCYRQQADFSVNSIIKQGDVMQDSDRPQSLIQIDSRVANNYSRLVSTSFANFIDGRFNDITGKEANERMLGSVRDAVLRVLPGLRLTSLGNAMSDGTFFFEKGNSQDWRYKNLSGGEKAAFDLILDFVVKTQGFNNTVFCIDEPEVHMHTSVQAALLNEMLCQLPEHGQLWVATHSAGMMRAARDLGSQRPGEVVFLDFSGHNFDEPVVMTPSVPDRAFWKRNFQMALGDMARLVAPDQLVFCEGATRGDGTGFDATCYEIIFEREFPQVEFISSGGATEVQKHGFSMKAVMERIVPNVQITLLRDLDDCSPPEVEEYKRQGIRVLSRRTIESFLWCEETLEKLCVVQGQADKIDQVKTAIKEALDQSHNRGNPSDDVKSAIGTIRDHVRKILGMRQGGNNPTAFARDTLAPLITPETRAYQELKRDIFGE